MTLHENVHLFPHVLLCISALHSLFIMTLSYYYVQCSLLVEVIMLGFGLYVAICVGNLYASDTDKNKDQKWYFILQGKQIRLC